MNRLDPVLRLLIKNDMELLLLEPGHRPRLKKGSTERVASQTVLTGEAIDQLLGELAPSDLLSGEDARSIAQFDYSMNGQVFCFQLSKSLDGWTALVAAGEKPVEVRPVELVSSGSKTATEPETPPIAEQVSAPPVETAGSFPSVVELLGLSLERDASDLHLGAGQVPRLRISGDLVVLDHLPAPTSETLEGRIKSFMPERCKKQFDSTNDVDFAYALEDRARFRVNVFRDRLGIGAVFRQIPNKIPSVEELGLPESLRGLADLAKGLVLVTGPTGSGKSTTLAAILDLINSEQMNHIITIEDPIEFVHPSKMCLVNQREVGVHTDSFKQALRAALREDPDVVLVGEMRDLETTAIAIETAETGHLVFGTLHTTSAPSTIERLVDQYPSDRQSQIRMMLAGSLKAVVSQTLLKKKGGGRVAAFEVLFCTSAVSNLIREGKTFQIISAMQTGRKIGMITLTESLVELVKKGLVEPDEAYRKAVDKEVLVNKLSAAGLAVPKVASSSTPVPDPTG